MNSMNYISHSNLRLGSRNEGKIKSYESCCDIRAWSHDVQVRDRYLREWMKCDMPICVIPSSILARFLWTMSCRSRGKVTPRCHPGCKSKILLDSICNSCQAMKECFRNKEEFGKYFDDEEFETSHWPCERCLEALKSIKMFWKIIIEKIFNITIPKDENLNHNECCCTDSLRSVAKVWQSEMVKEALFVKNISPFFKSTLGFPNPCYWRRKAVKKEPAPCNPKPCYQDCNDSNCCKKVSKPDCRNVIKSCKAKSTDTDSLSNPIVCKSNKTCSPIYSRKQCTYCTAKVKMVDVECDCDEEVMKIISAYKSNLELLQDKYNCQKTEIENLKRENSSLRIELQNVYKNSTWKSAFFAPSRCTSNHDAVAILPKPFECCPEETSDTNPTKAIDSEMIITMKNSRDETYRHISLLQVLHKTNDPDNMRQLNLENACFNRKEDPLELLTKVHKTFGAIVKREMGIANCKQHRERKSEIDATFNKVNGSKCASSCSLMTLASNYTNSI